MAVQTFLFNVVLRVWTQKRAPRGCGRPNIMAHFYNYKIGHRENANIMGFWRPARMMTSSVGLRAMVFKGGQPVYVQPICWATDGM